MRALGWTPGGDVSLGETLVDRHAASGRSALSWFGKDGSHREYTFGRAQPAQQPVRESARSPRRRPGRPRRGLSAARARDPRRHAGRVEGGRDLRAHLHGLWPRRDRVPHGAQRGDGAVHPLGACGPRSGPAARRRAAHHRDPARRDRARRRRASSRPWPRSPTGASPRASAATIPAVLLYTSGSTGPPKGVQIAANFLLAIHPSMRYGVDLRADDVFWPTGDPGWGYGLVCYMLALALGVTVTFEEAAPTAERCLARLAGRRRDEPRRDADAAAQPHGARRRGGARRIPCACAPRAAAASR